MLEAGQRDGVKLAAATVDVRRLEAEVEELKAFQSRAADALKSAGLVEVTAAGRAADADRACELARADAAHHAAVAASESKRADAAGCSKWPRAPGLSFLNGVLWLPTSSRRQSG